jgi:predicted PurR-regulated permease PerM
LQVSDAMKINTVTEEAYCLNSGLPILAENATLLCDHTRDFYSMQYSLVVNIGIVFLGALCFLFTAIYIIKDKERVERFVAGN